MKKIQYHKLPFYFIWLLKEIIISSFSVLRIIWTEKIIDPTYGFIEQPFDNRGMVIYANSITLTPGTLTIRVHNRLMVHALTHMNFSEFEDGIMNNKIMQLYEEEK
jgi:multicomponent Na+:H+ antiporter subunit E